MSTVVRFLQYSKALLLMAVMLELRVNDVKPIKLPKAPFGRAVTLFPMVRVQLAGAGFSLLYQT